LAPGGLVWGLVRGRSQHMNMCCADHRLKLVHLQRVFQRQSLLLTFCSRRSNHGGVEDDQQESISPFR